MQQRKGVGSLEGCASVSHCFKRPPQASLWKRESSLVEADANLDAPWVVSHLGLIPAITA